MRKLFSFFVLTSFILTATLVRADTIYLKNGSVLKGKVASFADDQFIVLLDMGGRSSSRAMIFTGDVTRIEFDSSPSSTASEGTSSSISTPVREVSRDPHPIEPPPSEKSSRDPESAKPNGSTEREKSSEKSTEKSTEKSSSETTPPESEPKREEEPKREPEPKRETESTPVEKVEKTDPPAEKPTRKPTGLVRTQTVDIVAKRDWTSTGLIVKRGDRITINASGTVTLDQGGERTSGPDGVELSDARKLMPDHPTGALIAVISSDNDDFIFIGRSAEFVATRDGLLFLSVNEGVLADNTGSYKAVIEIETPRQGR
jgi:sRNA-binding regulator protein Hfq